MILTVPLPTEKPLQKRTTYFIAIVVALCALPFASGQGKWEMRVCAPPDDYPSSSREHKGFENRIAEVIADELQANLRYVWAPFGAEMVQRLLWPGECDMIFGVADGAMGMVSTVPYYQTPYVFVYRRAGGLQLSSLDDAVLKELRITTYPAGAPYSALINQGLRTNIVLQQPDREAQGPDRFAPMMRALRQKKTDVVIAYGPEAGEFVRRHSQEFVLKPVVPSITAQGLQMLQTLTIGFRPGDDAFRDRVNVALANRWDDVQAVLESYGVPLLPLPQPLPPAPLETRPFRVGVILPIETGVPVVTDSLAAAAHVGALMADDLIGRSPGASEVPLQTLLASGPNLAAVVRSAERLVSTEGANVLVGGLDELQARALSRIAEERDVVYFNIGAQADELRTACRRNTFHIEASTSMYLDALTRWFVTNQNRRWFVVYSNSAQGRQLYRQARETIARGGGNSQVVGEAEVEPGFASYQQELERIRDAAPDVVLLLLDPQQQEQFLSQYTFEVLDYLITGIPYTVMQTREYLARLQQVAPGLSLNYRAALWEASIEGGEAGALTENFTSRSGLPMDPIGWSTYAAVQIAYEAFIIAKSPMATALVGVLEDPLETFEVQKGEPTSFRTHDHQLQQPLYLIRIDPMAEWGAAVSNKLSLAEFVTELPISTHLRDVSRTDGSRKHESVREPLCRR